MLPPFSRMLEQEQSIERKGEVIPDTIPQACREVTNSKHGL